MLQHFQQDSELQSLLQNIQFCLNLEAELTQKKDSQYSFVSWSRQPVKAKDCLPLHKGIETWHSSPSRKDVLGILPVSPLEANRVIHWCCEYWLPTPQNFPLPWRNAFVASSSGEQL